MMNAKKVYPIAVIGGGSAGVMAVLRGLLNNDEVLFFPGSPKNRKRSRAFWVAKVENIPGYHHYKKGIDDPNKETLQWLSEGPFAKNLDWKKNTGVESLQKNPDGTFQLTDDKGATHSAHYVVLCTGVMDIQPEIGGSIQPILPYANVQLADYCLRCDGHHTLGKKTAVIGEDNGAAWVAVMLYERYRNPSMCLLTNGKKAAYDGDAMKLVERYKFPVFEQKITSITGDSKQNILQEFNLEDGVVVDVECVFISLGMMVYNQLALEVGATVDGRGFVLTDAKGATNVPGLYVAGDLRANAKKQIYTAQDQAVDALDQINAELRKARRSLPLF